MNTEEIYEAAFNDELEKIAISRRVAMNAFLKRVSGSKAISDKAKGSVRKNMIEAMKEESNFRGKLKTPLSDIKFTLRQKANRIYPEDSQLYKTLKGKKFDKNLDKGLRSLKIYDS